MCETLAIILSQCMSCAWWISLSLNIKYLLLSILSIDPSCPSSPSPLPQDWVAVGHNSGGTVYLHKPTRACTWARPYCVPLSKKVKVKATLILLSMVEDLTPKIAPEALHCLSVHMYVCVYVFVRRWTVLIFMCIWLRGGMFDSCAL